MKLPRCSEIPVNKIASCFNNTVASYKFYWFLAILEAIEDGKKEIPKKEIFARMIANAWYTVNYYKLSFGKSDLIHDAVRQIKNIENIDIDEHQSKIYKKLLESKNEVTNVILWHFNKNVPHWFLSPWFPGCNRSQIYEKSQIKKEKCLYSLMPSSIIIDDDWYLYLFKNIGVFKHFCYWNLAMFIQARNPSVPDVPNKLIKPAFRNSLYRQRTQFWDIVVSELDSVYCIYTGNRIEVGNYDVEHFVPYSFVSHDLMWNLLPSDSSFNKIKSDKLPDPEVYFDPFYGIQKMAVEIIIDKFPQNRFLEDYLMIFPDVRNISKERYREQIIPLITIASNNGFDFLGIKNER